MGKNKLVAVSQNKDKVFIVKNISDVEYNKILNIENEKESLKELEKKQLYSTLESHSLGIEKLFKRDLLLAKAIYDNYVIRGLLEKDNDFEKQWFEFYLNGGELHLENAPKEFKDILNKVGNL